MISPSLGSRKRTASTRSKPKLKMSLEAIKYERGRLEILDQLHLPASHIFITLNDTKDAWDAIKKMQVIFVLWSIRVKIFVLTVKTSPSLNGNKTVHRIYSLY